MTRCEPPFTTLLRKIAPPPCPALQRQRALEAERRGTGRWVRLVTDATLALFAALLGWAGYPGWRVGVFTAALLVTVLVHVWAELARRRTRPRPDARERQRVEVTLLLLLLAHIGVTGGFRSPLFPATVLGLPLELLLGGRIAVAHQARGKWLALAGATALFAVVPAAWTGPMPAAPLYWSMLVLGASELLLLVARSNSLTRHVADHFYADALRAREELVTRATARARELELLGGRISHELKNPLSAIKTLAQASTRTTTDPDVRERLEVIEREVSRMEEALQGYLSFSRPLAGLTPSATSLARLADDVLQLLAGRAEEAGVTLRRRGDAVADVDARQVKDAVLNLVVNALQASPRGAEVLVEIRSEGACAFLSVKDHGRAIPADVLARIGTPFFTTREHGAGLGVTVARAIFEHHGGGLAYASVPGAGTTATATLPLHAREEP